MPKIQHRHYTENQKQYCQQRNLQGAKFKKGKQQTFLIYIGSSFQALISDKSHIR
jgi:predicted SPOUT superfamily RNA methylase MTH1